MSLHRWPASRQIRLWQGATTAFGAFLDPVADKLMVAAVLILISTRPLPAGTWAGNAWLLPVLSTGRSPWHETQFCCAVSCGCRAGRREMNACGQRPIKGCWAIVPNALKATR